MTLRLGTRGSALALAQARWVADALAAGGNDVEIVEISTAGDRSQAPSFGSIGPQGVFVKEIEEQLVAGTIDFAVHSFKDLPTRSPDGLVVAAVPERADPEDYLLINATAFDESGGALPLPAGARIGTSSARRQRWLEHLRPDVVTAPLRGNVPTRVGRVRDGDYDAIVLARAGLTRLDDLLPDLPAIGIRLVRLAAEIFVPAPAQGALALQCREADGATAAALAALDDPTTRVCVDAERALLARAEGGCDAAFGACCGPLASGGFELLAMADIGGELRAASVSGDDAARLPAAIWPELAGDI